MNEHYLFDIKHVLQEINFNTNKIREHGIDEVTTLHSIDRKLTELYHEQKTTNELLRELINLNKGD